MPVECRASNPLSCCLLVFVFVCVCVFTLFFYWDTEKGTINKRNQTKEGR